MLHGQVTPRTTHRDPKAARIADLSDEYLRAGATRREEIGEEIAGLIAGRITALPVGSNVHSLPNR